MNGSVTESTTPKSQTVKWIEPAKQEDKANKPCGDKTTDKVTEPYEIIIGSNSDIYGFTRTMTLKFETLAEVETALPILVDLILGFGEDGSAIMVTKPETDVDLKDENK